MEVWRQRHVFDVAILEAIDARVDGVFFVSSLSNQLEGNC